MMRMEVLVEEPSMEKALRIVLPKLLNKRADLKLINMRSKGRLLHKLPDRLKAYRRLIAQGEDLRVIVVVDQDDDDCTILKRRLERAAREARLPTKSSPAKDGHFSVVNRIAIVELESWFMGDQEALRRAFGRLRGVRFPPSFDKPDKGGTWKRLHRFLRQQGIYSKKYPKIKAAETIAPHMAPDRNRSRSFNSFREGVEACLS